MPITNDLKTPPSLSINIVKSLYPSASFYFTTISVVVGVTCIISAVFALPSKYGNRESIATLMFGLNGNQVATYLLLATILSIIGCYIGYVLERKILYLGRIEISCETEEVNIETKEINNAIYFSSISRFLYDINAIKNTFSFSSINSIGAQNFIELELSSEKNNLKLEIAINSNDEADILKQISFYHSTKYRR